MDFTLDELWVSYLADKEPTASNEEMFITEMMEQDEELLRVELNEKQELLLNVLLSRRELFAEVYGKECFKKGVKFATKYLLEATQNDKR